MQSEREKMVSGQVYSATDAELLAGLWRTKELVRRYNDLRPSDFEGKLRLLGEILGRCPDDAVIMQPFYCDYGKQISLGRRFFANHNLVILDEAPVEIGDDCFLGPNVGIYTACHSTSPAERGSRREWARPVRIGNGCWIGGSVTVLPGVEIGDGSTVGAGSVVVRDIPPYCVAAGNPAVVVKKL